MSWFSRSAEISCPRRVCSKVCSRKTRVYSLTFPAASIFCSYSIISAVRRTPSSVAMSPSIILRAVSMPCVSIRLIAFWLASAKCASSYRVETASSFSKPFKRFSLFCRSCACDTFPSALSAAAGARQYAPDNSSERTAGVLSADGDCFF